MKNLKDKIVLVTGASGGIGRGISIALAKKGAFVIVSYVHDKEGAKETYDSVIKAGGSAITVQCDISAFNSAKKLAEFIGKRFSRVDILVNNAGITKDRTLKNMTKEEWNEVIATNLTGMFNITKNVLPLIPNGGRIINISSVVGILGNFGQCNYAASKAGVIGFTKSLAKELSKYGITVNAIAPGFIDTKMTSSIPKEVREHIISSIPLKRFGKPEEIANTVAFLASDEAGYITGTTIRVDGGINF
jgi:3-oxoacyl-[acyl-carrier protein] reductase